MLIDFSKFKFDIIIQAGQSNADGTGFGPAETPYAPDERIWYLQQGHFRDGFIVRIAEESVFGSEIKGDFSLSFSSEYIKAGLLADDRCLLIIRSAVGGTGFGDNRWGPGDDLFLRMKDMVETALGLNPENRLKCLLWHQGETDVHATSDKDIHKENLSRLIGLVRDTYGCSGLPFVAGDFVPRWNEWLGKFSAVIADAMREVCSEVGNAAFVETAGLLSNQEQNGGWDIIHFSRDALNKLGARYFEAYRGIID